MATSYVGPGGQWVTTTDVANREGPNEANATHTAVLSANTVVFTGPCILYGVKVVIAGTSISVFDNTSAAGVSVITAEATTAAGAVITPGAAGQGVRCDLGIFLAPTGGTYIVNFQPL